MADLAFDLAALAAAEHGRFAHWRSERLRKRARKLSDKADLLSERAEVAFNALACEAPEFPLFRQMLAREGR